MMSPPASAPFTVANRVISLNLSEAKGSFGISYSVNSHVEPSRGKGKCSHLGRSVQSKDVSVGLLPCLGRTQ